MKKLVLILVIFILFALAFFSKIYLSSIQPVKIAEKKAIALAEKKVKLSKVDDFHLYNRTETVYVIEGKNEHGEKIIIWIPEKSKNVVVKKAKDGITKSEAVQKLEETKNPKKIVSVRLGMIHHIPSWEIYYHSDNNLINYYYIDFESGEWLKKYENF
ncbi:MAG TPA: DUF5590 domain-containing protein [Bacillales bacterium]|nr:DUF5590 domain-containing protein [Bacillales bacterium]